MANYSKSRNQEIESEPTPNMPTSNETVPVKTNEASPVFSGPANVPKLYEQAPAHTGPLTTIYMLAERFESWPAGVNKESGQFEKTITENIHAKLGVWLDEAAAKTAAARHSLHVVAIKVNA